MEELIKWIIENKALLIMACVTLSISIPVSIHFGKTIINYNNNIKKNKTINNYKSGHHNQNNNSYSRSGQTTPNIANSTNPIELTKIFMYSTGKRGKVYTTEFYK